MPANPKIEPIEKTGLAKVYTLKRFPRFFQIREDLGKYSGSDSDIVNCQQNI